MKSPNRLGHKGNFALVTWIQHNLPRFQTEHPSDDLVAQQATAALGFEVRRGNIRTVRNEFGWKWAKPKAPRATKRSIDVYHEIQSLRSDFDGLMVVVRDLLVGFADDPATLPSLKNLSQALLDRVLAIDALDPAQPLFSPFRSEAESA